MPLIALSTTINAASETCFDLSRSIDLHKVSTSHTHEEAVAGRTSGLIGDNESVTWRARHFGVWLKLTSRITRYQPPYYFRDEQISGPFKEMVHDHRFKKFPVHTIMTDEFYYRAPYGLLGKLADRFLEDYLLQLLKKRNTIIKHYAESGSW